MMRIHIAGLLALFAGVAMLPFLVRAEDRAGAAAQTGADAEGFVPLFNGKDLEGWKVNENPDTFKVEGGHIVVKGDRSHAFYVGPVENHNFKNFHLKLEIMTKPMANSGVYFHTEYQDSGWPNKGFEAQVNQTHGDPKKTGGLYAVKDVMDKSAAKDDEWYTYEIIVQGNKVTIKVNGETTTEWEQPADWQPPAGHEGKKLGSGTFALQGHDPGSEIHYKSIAVKPLPE